ncbi:hypothetical protein [Lachnoclostridium sp. An118]|uniref:hypothetical protein n=1 Tax=Lachnoclostridium sp. An118 TaxID=1965547 RepID=UPI000B392026|nr:hypothetical protein [Lachnoclostridium sp. An118]OUQ52529.1 hypothetical protein B5E62_01105 [Lachnoclostridium sp. An118]
MLTEIRKCVDANDIKGLRYIFVDCLDVDPTFEKYKPDYEYCTNMDGLFESYRELTPLSLDKAAWDMNYWEQLKLDLMKNFSRKRFEHMREVAKVVYAEKIGKLFREREQQRAVTAQTQDSEEKKIESLALKNKTEKAEESQIVQENELEEEKEKRKNEAERGEKSNEKNSQSGKETKIKNVDGNCAQNCHGRGYSVSDKRDSIKSQSPDKIKSTRYFAIYEKDNQIYELSEGKTFLREMRIDVNGRIIEKGLYKRITASDYIKYLEKKKWSLLCWKCSYEYYIQKADGANVYRIVKKSRVKPRIMVEIIGSKLPWIYFEGGAK